MDQLKQGEHSLDTLKCIAKAYNFLYSPQEDRGHGEEERNLHGCWLSTVVVADQLLNERG